MSVEAIVSENLAHTGASILARVPDGDRATDFVLELSPRRLAVIRSMSHSTKKDRTALATMISEGDFIWGAVVYEEGEPPRSPGLIETFHISQLDQLVARLVELREACREAG